MNCNRVHSGLIWKRRIKNGRLTAAVVNDPTLGGSRLRRDQMGMRQVEKPAVVLLSGGLDSTVTLALAVDEGYQCYALTFAYGQRHDRELQSAAQVARRLGVTRHVVVNLDPVTFAGSALTGSQPVPVDRPTEEMSAAIPATYVPARNTVFLALGLAYAEQVGAFDIFIGANAVDYSGYPDCRPEFIDAFERLANLATRAAACQEGTFRIHAPLIDKPKTEIVTLALDLQIDPGLTWSCYNPDPLGRPCTRCDACVIRQRAFKQAGAVDPLAP